MKIVNIEDFFHPNAGYQINILPKYLVKAGHETYIITSEMEKVPDQLTSFFGKIDVDKYDREYEASTGVKVIRVPVIMFVSNRAVFTNEIYKVLNQLKPDVIFAHGCDTWIGMVLIGNQRKLNCGFITDSHMLEMASSNHLKNLFRLYYKLFIVPHITKNNTIVIRTQDDLYVQKCLGIPLSQAPWISYGSDTLLFHPDNIIKAAFKKENGISEDAFVFVYTGKLDEGKGGLFFAQSIEKQLNTKREVVFVIVGNATGDYGERVEDAFQLSEYRILRLPTQRYIDLAKYYQSADAIIFPKQCSLSFYDAQACGLPVVSENNNINIERNSHGNGYCFEMGNSVSMRDAMEKMVNLPYTEFDQMRNNSLAFINKGYDYQEKANEYLDAILNTVKK